MRKLSLAALIMVSLTACSDTQENKEKNAEEQKIEKKSPLTEHKLVKVINKENQSTLVKEKVIESEGADLGVKVFERLKAKNNNILLNKQKFELLSDKLIKGAKVFNLVLSEPGIVKGTFVVISNNTEKLTNLVGTVRVDEIEKNTYRLTPKEDVDFLQYYKSLLGQKQFQTVEVEIDYSGISRRLLTQER
jgi:hypothetical protein